jgi:hypothetical protein
MPRNLETEFDLQATAAKLPRWKAEHLFCPGRRWRFDRAWPVVKVALEIDGGTFKPRSRHGFGIGYRNDCVKMIAAQLLGWMVLKVDATMVRDGYAVILVRAALESRVHAYREDEVKNVLPQYRAARRGRSGKKC